MSNRLNAPVAFVLLLLALAPLHPALAQTTQLSAMTGVSLSGGTLHWDSVAGESCVNRRLGVGFRTSTNTGWRTVSNTPKTSTSRAIVANHNDYNWVEARIRKVSACPTDYTDSDWVYACNVALCSNTPPATATPAPTPNPTPDPTPDPSPDPAQPGVNSFNVDDDSGGDAGGGQSDGDVTQRKGDNSFSSSAPRKAAAARPRNMDGMMLPTDNRLNAHAAAPVVAFARAGNLQFWHALSDSEGVAIGSVPDVKALTVAGHAGGELLRATHPESGKIVTVTYRPGFQMIEVNTFYPDTAHQTNKLYTFCIMDNNHVEVVFW